MSGEVAASGADGDRDPLIIAVAPNGARRTKRDHPALPITPAELAEEAARCRAAGASMIHLHVRDAEDGHSLDPGRYREATAAIRARVGDDMVIQVTTEAAGRFAPAEQMAAMRDLRPEAMSIAMRELLPEGGDVEAGADFLAEMRAGGTLLQYILYDAEDARRFASLRASGRLPGGRASVLYVLGRYRADSRSVPRDLLSFLNAVADDPSVLWSVCAFGPLEAGCCLTAAGLGGHVRVGFENNLLLADGGRAPDNAALVTQIADAAPLMGRQVAGAAHARALMAA
ncbi:3-keto-5-aminohexanoate cleavage protein [Marivibrio halodurans]|uniref:3-keto-5-aminohexanoate cleavage protein n=1 Tax=Marivibrio halodurans TaxID=2039722 RepID=A0A8J7S2V9_9PROT|nr:3-keto-5-aminohexanoate cleavage protein [Marivibrio halodurans]MBP5857578.1 3-keto-5-aminohexanoate cleavage protein [Marivibrio halodurans]